MNHIFENTVIPGIISSIKPPCEEGLESRIVDAGVSVGDYERIAFSVLLESWKDLVGSDRKMRKDAVLWFEEDEDDVLSFNFIASYCSGGEKNAETRRKADPAFVWGIIEKFILQVKSKLPRWLLFDYKHAKDFAGKGICSIRAAA